MTATQHVATRLHAPQARRLALADISGSWWPSSGFGVFAVTWGEPGRYRWAPLHEFTEDAQRRLIAECLRADRDTNGPKVIGSEDC